MGHHPAGGGRMAPVTALGKKTGALGNYSPSDAPGALRLQPDMDLGLICPFFGQAGGASGRRVPRKRGRVGGIEHQEDSKLRIMSWLWGNAATAQHSQKSETGSAFHNRRAKNEAKMCFLPDDASSNTLKELEGSPK